MSTKAAEIRCPHCGALIDLDEDAYAKVASQVRDQEFTREIESRVEAAVKAAVAAAHAEATTREQELEKKRLEELNQLKSSAVELKAEHQAELTKLKVELEKRAQEQLTQVQERLLSAQHALEQKDQEFELKLAREREQLNLEKSTLTQKLVEVEQRLSTTEQLKEAEHTAAITKLEREYDQKLALKDSEIEKAHTELESWKSYKQQQNTKQIGEDLEQFCYREFQQYRSLGLFQNAQFDKDNDAIKEIGESKGTKGDFIYREFDDEGNEILSIMFEMKSQEMGATYHKKNEDHFGKLDKDRRKKNCEYAVLVSWLEPDNELYNRGIVDVSYAFEKMYVVRPQFFITLISILSAAAKNQTALKKRLREAEDAHIDLANFETQMDLFKDKFGKNVASAQKNYESAISGIDDAIKKLEKIKKLFETSSNQLRLANDKAQDLTIRKLTKNSPKLRAAFNDEKKRQELESALDGDEEQA